MRYLPKIYRMPVLRFVMIDFAIKSGKMERRNMRKTGRIVDWNDSKGYGFIDSGDGGRQAFVHINDFPRGSRRPVEGDEVSYEESEDKRGRPKAAEARLVSAGVSFNPTVSAGLTALLALGAVTGISIAELAPWWIPVAFLAASLIAVVVYGLDKKAAATNGTRIPDALLHLLSIAGGWPGAFYAQRRFHHKTRKTAFQIVFAVTIFLNLAGLFLFCWSCA